MLSRWARKLVGVVFCLAAWEILARSGHVPRYFLPSLFVIFGDLLKADNGIIVLTEVALTLQRSVAGYLIAIAVGTPLGVVMGRSTLVSEVLKPIVEFLRPLPSSAIIPVALLFLGLGWEMVVFVVAFGCVWPILVASSQGAQHVDPLLLDASRLLGVGRISKFALVVVPAAAPYIMAGWRTSLAVSLILAVTAEMIAGSSGIGFYILDMERAFRTSEMYGGILVIGVVGLALNKVFETFERRVLYWTL